MGKSIYHSQVIYNCFKNLRLGLFLSDVHLKHIMAVLTAVFVQGFHGKTVDFAACSPCHRTTVAHFLNHGKWDDASLEKVLKRMVTQIIYRESMISGKPVFCIADDTISSKTKPSSRALHPIEDAYFHQSHLKRRQDYGHQAVAVMLSCNGMVLHYATVMYDKSRSKIQILCDIAEELSQTPVPSYFLCDSWYTSGKIMDTFIKKGFYMIGALRTNRVLYPYGIRQKISSYALHFRKTDKDVRLVTAGNRQYYVYRYEGSLNGVENAVVLISYPKEAFHSPKALRAFICTDVSLETEEILNTYVERWLIEIFFRQSKGKLAFNKYQIRTSKGIRRYWLLMSLAHLICCTGTGKCLPFEKGYAIFQKQLRAEKIEYIYQCGVRNASLEDLLTLAG